MQVDYIPTAEKATAIRQYKQLKKALADRSLGDDAKKSIEKYMNLIKFVHNL